VNVANPLFRWRASKSSTNTKQVRQWEQQTATKGPPVGTKDSDGEGSAKVRQWEQEVNAIEVHRSASGNKKRTRGKCKGPPVGTGSKREGIAKVHQWERTTPAREAQRSAGGNGQRPRAKRKTGTTWTSTARNGFQSSASERGTEFKH